MPNNQNIIPIDPQNGDHHQLELFPVAEVEIDGIQMGVLSDGTPYLSLRGLARMCGVSHSVLLPLANSWPTERSKPRGRKIDEILSSSGFTGDSLIVLVRARGGENFAFTDKVCMAILEYYAFDSPQSTSDTASKNYRLLARLSFRKFIFDKCGYDPDKHIPQSWKNFHERVLLNDQIPLGYFSVFREVADIIIHMIRAGCPLDDHTVPDVSVGMVWGEYWTKNLADKTYGVRKKHPHNFPEWFPQAQVGPVPAWVYPLEALGAFRVWLQDVYLPEKFPNYITQKVRSGAFLPSRGQALIDAVKRPELERPGPHA